MSRNQPGRWPRAVAAVRTADHSQLWLGVAVVAANMFGYAAIVVISVTFGPAPFGAVGALTSLGIIAGIPAGTLMVMIASRVGRGEDVSWAFGLSITVGAAEALLLVASSPVLVHVFDLDSLWPVLWLGLTLIPATLFGAQQGLLLGSAELARLSLLFACSGMSRLAAAAVCVALRPTVSVAYGMWLLAAIVTFALGCGLTSGLAPLYGRVRGMLPEARRLGKASFVMMALITLTSIDTILARHLLSPEESGIYSVASIFAKVMFWGTQFIAMVTVPKLSRRAGPFLVVKAYAAVLAVSAPVVAVIAVDPLFWLTSVGLDEYEDAAGLLVRFALLGILWSLIQVTSFADMGGSRTHTVPIIWLALAVQCTLTFTVLGSSPAQIWLAATIAAACVTVANLIGETLRGDDRRGRHRRDRDGGEHE